MNTIIRTEEFATWLDGLRDAKGKARIISRLDLAALGNFGDCEPSRSRLRRRAKQLAQQLKESKHGKAKN